MEKKEINYFTAIIISKDFLKKKKKTGFLEKHVPYCEVHGAQWT